MNRTTWLQDRRMQKFRDVLSRWEAGELSMLEAGELLGMSERKFRRYRGPYEDDGSEGLTAAARGVTEQRQVGTWRNRGVTTAGTGWPPRNAKGARPCPRASSMSASTYH
jgi:hypothetical protein